MTQGTAQSPAQLAQLAQTAMAAGRFHEAHPILANLRAMLPQDPMIPLMQAYAYRAQGKGPEAHAHFKAAIALRPGDPALIGPYATWLSDLGEFENAVAQFDAMLAAQPQLDDARIDRLVALANTARREEALAGLAEFVREKPENLRAANNLALLLREDDRMEEALAQAEATLARAPDNPRAAYIAAQAMQELGRDASALQERATRLNPDALQLHAASAQSHVDRGDAEKGIAALEAIVATNPGWLEGHRSLADMKYQAFGPEGFDSHYEAAHAASPRDGQILVSWAGQVARVEGQEAALAILDRADDTLDRSQAVRLSRANTLSELGRYDEAEALFARLDPASDATIAKGFIRFLVRAKRFEEARDLGMRLADEGRADGDIWPYTAIGLRKTEDPRWEWLEGRDEFIRTFDIETMRERLPELREALEALHVYRHQPIAQSVRGGTQTANILFRNEHPAIQSLVGELRACVREYVDGLPPHDPAHPLLRLPREGFRFSGSWSIRLSGGGFHASHVHTHGDISSAFYVTLPPDLGEEGQGANGSDPHSGWLALGEPAAELDTGLAPIRLVKPEPARLALFPSTMWHGTRPFGEGERMTCAFDVRLKPYA